MFGHSGYETKPVEDLFIELCSRVAGSAEPWIRASVSELARTTGLSPRTIFAALRRLEELKLIHRESGGGTQITKITVLAFMSDETADDLRTAETGDIPEGSIIPAAS